MQLTGECFGRLQCSDANRFAGLNINEGCSHLAPVAKLQGALAQAAIRYKRDGVGGTAIDFYEGYGALAVGTLRVGDSQQLQPVHSKPDAEYLASAQMSMCDCCILQVLIERLH